MAGRSCKGCGGGMAGGRGDHCGACRCAGADQDGPAADWYEEALAGGDRRYLDDAADELGRRCRERGVIARKGWLYSWDRMSATIRRRRRAKLVGGDPRPSSSPPRVFRFPRAVKPMPHDLATCLD